MPQAQKHKPCPNKLFSSSKLDDMLFSVIIYTTDNKQWGRCNGFFRC